jgi:hypothetical protein
MSNSTVKHAAKAGAAELHKIGNTAEKIAKGNGSALSEGGKASRAAFQELTAAYQELAAKNAKNLAAAIKALTAVKDPAGFVEVQQKLIKEGVEAAVSDSQRIAQLTVAVFTAAFEPIQKQLESVQKTALN